MIIRYCFLFKYFKNNIKINWQYTRIFLRKLTSEFWYSYRPEDVMLRASKGLLLYYLDSTIIYQLIYKWPLKVFHLICEWKDEGTSDIYHDILCRPNEFWHIWKYYTDI
jgi:hypothetical protein